MIEGKDEIILTPQTLLSLLFGFDFAWFILIHTVPGMTGRKHLHFFNPSVPGLFKAFSLYGDTLYLIRGKSKPVQKLRQASS